MTQPFYPTAPLSPAHPPPGRRHLYSVCWIHLLPIHGNFLRTYHLRVTATLSLFQLARYTFSNVHCYSSVYICLWIASVVWLYIILVDDPHLQHGSPGELYETPTVTFVQLLLHWWLLCYLSARDHLSNGITSIKGCSYLPLPLLYYLSVTSCSCLTLLSSKHQKGCFCHCHFLFGRAAIGHHCCSVKNGVLQTQVCSEMFSECQKWLLSFCLRGQDFKS